MSVTLNSILPAGKHVGEKSLQINGAAVGSGHDLILAESGGNIQVASTVTLGPGEAAEFIWTGTKWVYKG